MEKPSKSPVENVEALKLFSVCLADSSNFNAYVFRCKALSYYDTGITAEYGDKLLTLSTCEYTNTNGRLVVVAKRIT